MVHPGLSKRPWVVGIAVVLDIFVDVEVFCSKISIGNAESTFARHTQALLSLIHLKRQTVCILFILVLGVERRHYLEKVGSYAMLSHDRRKDRLACIERPSGVVLGQETRCRVSKMLVVIS